MWGTYVAGGHYVLCIPAGPTLKPIIQACILGQPRIDGALAQLVGHHVPTGAKNGRPWKTWQNGNSGKKSYQMGH